MAGACDAEPGSDDFDLEGVEDIEDADEDRFYLPSFDDLIRFKLQWKGVVPVTPPPAQDPALVALGQQLFFDRELSGRRNISCSTCHHPTLGSADAQSQSRAQGGTGLGPDRVLGPNTDFLPRNALSLWNRGVEGWDVMFWDGRLEGNAVDGFVSPAGADTPQNFSTALAAFTMLPITPDEEMRGFPFEADVFGNPNELAGLTDSDFVQIWDALVTRVVAIPAYRDQFLATFPGITEEEIDIVNVSEAIGAFMSEAFTALDSPFDRYLAGDDHAISFPAKAGALLFYGRASCSSCHSGALQTDFGFHNIAAPQVGGGRPEDAPLDRGRGRITGDPTEFFQFRTPSLRNIELEGPYMHNGAFVDLEDAVRHHLDPAASLAAYDESQVEPELVGTLEDDPALINELLSTLDPALAVQGPPLHDYELFFIMEFLASLTDESTIDQSDLIPESVPSGLPLD